MTQQTRTPNTKRRPAPRTRLRRATTGLTEAITELIYLSAEDQVVVARKIELLRTRRQQLSAVIDRLSRFSPPP